MPSSLVNKIRISTCRGVSGIAIEYNKFMQPIDHFRHCPSCGAANAGKTNPFVCVACGFAYYFNPTVSAGVFLSDGEGRLLVVRREKDPGKGLLGIPGGFIDIGESAEDALRREVREEVGLEIDEVRFLASFPNQYPYRGVTYPVCDLIFTGRALNPESAQSLDGVAGIEWRTPAKLGDDEFAFESMRRALRVIRAS